MSDSSYKSHHCKVRALIADDSRIVRATLAKHLCDLFDFSEAHDGEQAWDALLRDEDIALLITDLTMPRLDGYGLLRRMRSSRAQRLREMPVVVISGADEADERRRATEAGGTDLITKGMATAPLVSRLDLLAQLVIAQAEYEAELEAARKTGADEVMLLGSPYGFQSEALRRLGYAMRQQENFALLSLSVASHPGISDADLHSCIAGMLRRMTRQSDVVARTGKSDFTIATGNLDLEAMRSFADRLCCAASQALAQKDIALTDALVCCGTAGLAEPGAAQPPSLHEMWDTARRRSIAGLKHRRPGVIGAEEESVFHGS